MRVAGNLRVPTGCSRDILHQAKGIIGIESTQIRWFSQWPGGGGCSGRAKLSGGQESQNEGPRDCLVATLVGNNWGSEGGPGGQIKNYSHDNLLKENRAMTNVDRLWQMLTGYDKCWLAMTNVDRLWQMLTGCGESRISQWVFLEHWTADISF